MRLRRTKDLWDHTIGAADADIGTVHDFHFDDEKWTIRYLAVETGVVFSGSKVLISPIALRDRAWSPLHILTKLTSKQVQTSPGIDLHERLRSVFDRVEMKFEDRTGWGFDVHFVQRVRSAAC